MKSLLVTLTVGVWAALCASQVTAQSGGGAAGAGGGSAGAGGVGGATGGAAAGAGVGGGTGAGIGAGVGGGAGFSGSAGSSVPAPAGITAGNAGATQTPSNGSMTGNLGGTLPSNQSGTATIPPNTVQNPITAQGSGGGMSASGAAAGTGGVAPSGTVVGQSRPVDRNDWRLARFNNEWWYWMPGDYWVYYRNNTWSRYNPYGYQPQMANATPYAAGYRGLSNETYYYDENGLRYRRFYAPDIPRNAAMEARNPNTIGGAAGSDTGSRGGAEIGGAVRNQ